jgi:uncharacterized protein YyaL (SSP411 family)
MPANRLAREKSPYLLQHAHNPVDWHPWGEEAFAKARAEDKPIFLSIGYSTCHWCHVMERESFESEETAALLNRFFVAVKVDREERPDVDSIYMLYVQAATGGGGWPMSVFLTPDLKPFFGGTYFPPDNRYGRPGFPSILRSVAEAWNADRPRILESGVAILEQLSQHAGISPGSESWRDDALAERAFRGFQGEFDAEFGGFGGAPKFPRTVVHHFLLRYWARSGHAEAAGMVFATLEAMARGGMHDQLGGGFHRYSVDERWFVPHFEKMLYDQALLAVSYLEAYQASGDGFHARVARSIFDYVLHDMISPEGAFYSAEDADSAADPDRPGVKSEGAFYLWRKSEIEQLLGEQAAAPFCDLYGVREGGNVEFDPHGEFGGRNILYAAGSLDQVAELGDARRKLLEARSLRPRPHLDDKILTAWNALMISALACGAQVLGEPRLGEAARRAAGFVLSRLYDAPAGKLLRRFRDGDAAIGGFLDDYAFLAQALLDLYQADFHPRWLEQALALTEQARELFEDASGGGFFGAIAAPDLVLRMKNDHDGAEPSANSIMVSNLLRLAEITGRDDLRQSAERALDAFAGRLEAAPAALPQLLAAGLRAQAHPRQVVVAGDRQSADTEALVAEVRRRFLPDTLLLVADETSRAALARWNPAVGRMHPIEGKAAAYVCENFACREPVTEPGRLGKLLD